MCISVLIFMFLVWIVLFLWLNTFQNHVFCYPFYMPQLASVTCFNKHCGMMSWEWLFRMLFKSAYGQLYFAFANFLRGCLVKWQLSGLGQSMVPGLIPAKQIYGFRVWFWPPIDLYMVFYWIAVSFYAICDVYCMIYCIYVQMCAYSPLHFTIEYSVRGWLVKC